MNMLLVIAENNLIFMHILLNISEIAEIIKA